MYQVLDARDLMGRPQAELSYCEEGLSQDAHLSTDQDCYVIFCLPSDLILLMD